MLRKGSIRVSPLRVASALLLLISPFLTWITIVSVVVYQGVIVFGAAAQSSLMMVSADQLGTNITSMAIEGATFSMAFLILAGLAMFRTARLGVPLAIAGLFSYLLPFYQTFGTQTAGAEQTFISPGIGFFVAGMGIVLGLASPADRPESVAKLIHSLRTSQGLSKLGAFSSSVGLSLDVMNHAALGQLPDFIGQTLIQQSLHIGLVAGVSLYLFVVVLGVRSRLEGRLMMISAATLVLLGADAVFSIYTGNLHDFLGHNLTETVLHLSVYYGVALGLIAGFLGRQK